MKEDDFPVGDLSQEIARAKGMAKPHGPFRVACHACGKYYLPQHKAEHQNNCKPPSVHISAKEGLPHEGKTETRQVVPIETQHEQPIWDQVPPKKACPHCGAIKVNVEAHIAAKHLAHALGRFSTGSQKSQEPVGRTTPPISEERMKATAKSDSGTKTGPETGTPLEFVPWLQRVKSRIEAAMRHYRSGREPGSHLGWD